MELFDVVVLREDCPRLHLTKGHRGTICDRLLHNKPVEFTNSDSSKNKSSFNHKGPCNQMNLFGSPTKLFSIYKR